MSDYSFEYDFAPTHTFIQFTDENLEALTSLIELFGANGIHPDDWTIEGIQCRFPIEDGDWVFYAHDDNMWSCTMHEPDVYMCGGNDLKDASEYPAITYYTLTEERDL